MAVDFVSTNMKNLLRNQKLGLRVHIYYRLKCLKPMMKRSWSAQSNQGYQGGYLAKTFRSLWASNNEIDQLALKLVVNRFRKWKLLEVFLKVIYAVQW
jgi:hypothetical protein